jgi:2'-5' RNA ligase
MAAGDDLSAAAGGAPAPFVLTLELDGESFGRLNELRRRLYPPERNQVPAHVTLFYRLPGGRAREIKRLAAAAAAAQPPFDLAMGEAKALERGVALFLHAPQLVALRERLAAEWWPWLTDQDRAGFRPHVTLQNNVSAGEARRTMKTLAGLRLPRARAIGLRLWRYGEGAWTHEQLFRFAR